MYARLLLQLSLCLLLTASFAVAETATPVPAPAGEPAQEEVLPAAAPGLLVPAPAAAPMPVKSLTLEELNRKRLQRLQEVARDTRQQRDSMAEFDNYLNWMGGALAGYAKYVEAGSFAAGFAKYLPVPYAGQAGQLTKFISHFALSLSATSAAVKSYLASSGYFIAGVDAIGTSAAGREHELASLTFYADQQLSRDMSELQTRLATTSELSGSALSFLLGLQQYLGSTDEYWQKTKSLLGRKEADKGEKGAVAASVENLRTRAEAFNGRLKQYDETVNRTTLRIASLVAYDELRQDIEAKAGEVAVAAHDNK